MMARAGPWLAAVAACALAVQPLRAQTCDGKCAEEMGDPDLHYFGPIGVSFSGDAAPGSPFPEDSTTHGQLREGRCFIHAGCSEDDALLLADAVGKEDAARLDGLLVELDERARYNPRLGTIDVRCGSIVVAPIAVPRASDDREIASVLVKHLLRPYAQHMRPDASGPLLDLSLRSKNFGMRPTS